MLRRRAEDRSVGTLIIIGGREDKAGQRVILREVARRVGDGKLVIATVASREPRGYFEGYQRAFGGLGVENLEELTVCSRSEATDPGKLEVLEGASGIFFSGGDQFRITAQIGKTPIEEAIRRFYRGGGVVAGTSAGASAMCETMLVTGRDRESQRLGTLRMAPGLGFIDGVIIDQHFAERGRMGRLLGAVTQNPRELGIGIDENTAIIIEEERMFTVVGSGAVYVLDGKEITRSNVEEGAEEKALSVHDMRLHVLAEGDSFDLHARRPHALHPLG